MSLLSRSYPITDNGNRRMLTAFLISLFIALFLYVFRPFGLHAIPPHHSVKMIGGYGLVCFAILIIDLCIIPFLIPQWFDERKWTVGKEIIYVLWDIVTIGLANAWYSKSIFDGFITIDSVVYFQAVTFLVAIIPVTTIILIKQNILLRRNLKAAQHLNHNLHHKKRLGGIPDALLTIRSSNQNEDLIIAAEDLLFISSADNYIDVHYRNNGEEKNKLIRSTLKVAREDLKVHTAFYRCHRAYIVNLDRVKSVTGNSQGYRLVLDGTNAQVPVSRNLNQELTQRLSR